jgi:hypothetical protein
LIPNFSKITNPMTMLLEKPFDVYCDASGIGIGGILMQDGCTIAYALRQLQRHEEHYPTDVLEL